MYFVFMDDRIPFGKVNIFCIRQVGVMEARDMEFMTIKNGEPSWIKFGYNDPPSPFLTLPYQVADEMLPKIAEMLDGKGIKTENDHKIKGLLKAKCAHLEDMRALVFKTGMPIQKEKEE